MPYLEHNVYAKESKRHNLAIEKLTQAKEKWYEHQVEQKNKTQELRQQLSDANADINDTNHSLDLLKKVQSIQFEGRTFSREPQLNDYYKSSDKMKEYQYIVIGATGPTGGYLIHKYI